jgi:peptide deformylase
MALLDIRVLGDPILRERTRPVIEITDEIRTLIDDMFETMYAAEGIGLAAPQVGRSERIAVIDVDGHQYVLINPEIVSRGSNTDREEEGCLSIPEISGSVERPTTVVLRALDKDGNPYELEAEGLLARCIQHEVDHLDGRLFIDYFSLLKRRSATKKWEKEVTKYPNFIRKLEPLPQNAQRRRRGESAEVNDSSESNAE